MIFAMHALLVAEVAACRLWAFAREDGGVHVRSTTHTILGIEVVINLIRVVIAISPSPALSSLLPMVVYFQLYAVMVMLSSITTLLFLHYFSTAAAHSGVATTSLHIADCGRASLVIATSVLLMLVAAGPSLSSTHPSPSSASLLTQSITALTIFAPLLLVILCVRTERRVQPAIVHLPRALIARLDRRMRISIGWNVVALLLALVTAWAYYGPLRFVLVVPAYLHALTAISYVQVVTFKPIGLHKIPVGPLRTIELALAAVVREHCIGAVVSTPGDEQIQAADAHQAPSSVGRVHPTSCGLTGGAGGSEPIFGRSPLGGPLPDNARASADGCADLSGTLSLSSAADLSGTLSLSSAKRDTGAPMRAGTAIRRTARPWGRRGTSTSPDYE